MLNGRLLNRISLMGALLIVSITAGCATKLPGSGLPGQTPVIGKTEGGAPSLIPSKATSSQIPTEWQGDFKKYGLSEPKDCQLRCEMFAERVLPGQCKANPMSSIMPGMCATLGSETKTKCPSLCEETNYTLLQADVSSMPPATISALTRTKGSTPDACMKRCHYHALGAIPAACQQKGGKATECKMLGDEASRRCPGICKEMEMSFLEQ